VRLGLFGGSFDPFHAGHLRAAATARAALALERVVVLPTARPPHKPDRSFAPALARYAMAELALLDHPDLVVSDAELTLERPVYTIETIERFRAERPGDELHLIVGSDSLAELATWRRWHELLELVALAVVERPGRAPREALAAMPADLASALGTARVEWVEVEPHPASSTEIRRRLAAGEPLPAGWLDPRVLTFLQKYDLYR
jgi:nicotinate-nucleotide adenylyltransferase